MKFFIFLVLVSVVAAESDVIGSVAAESDVIGSVVAESDVFGSALKSIRNTLSTLNLRLARIENRQTTTESMNTRFEDKTNGIRKDLAQKHSETLLLHMKTVSLLTELKVKGENLETQQKAMMSQLHRFINNTDSCCHDNIPVICVNPTSTPIPTSQAHTKLITPTTQPTTTTTTTVQQDCKTADRRGALKDGVYQLAVGNQQIQVFCAGGYATFQRRYSGQLKFDRTFLEYERGFGLASLEHWMGLRYLHLMTKDKSCTFRARLAVDNTQSNKDDCGTKYAADCDGLVKEIMAREFRVSSAADKYQIHIVFNHTDFLYPDVKSDLKHLNGQRFTTKDQDNDQLSGVNCAARGWVVDAGFWYNDCGFATPNSVETSDKHFCSNSVCGYWYPYFFSSSLLQFSC